MSQTKEFFATDVQNVFDVSLNTQMPFDNGKGWVQMVKRGAAKKVPRKYFTHPKTYQIPADSVKVGQLTCTQLGSAAMRLTLAAADPMDHNWFGFMVNVTPKYTEYTDAKIAVRIEGITHDVEGLEALLLPTEFFSFFNEASTFDVLYSEKEEQYTVELPKGKGYASYIVGHKPGTYVNIQNVWPSEPNKTHKKAVAPNWDAVLPEIKANLKSDEIVFRMDGKDLWLFNRENRHNLTDTDFCYSLPYAYLMAQLKAVVEQPAEHTPYYKMKPSIFYFVDGRGLVMPLDLMGR